MRDKVSFRQNEVPFGGVIVNTGGEVFTVNTTGSDWVIQLFACVLVISAE
jgi:hypothetical protein